ncbi:MAG: DUF1289 domain-containing protein [Pseudomonadota bacterium]
MDAAELESEYSCVGVCMIDPDSGYCLGCGRPPLPVAEPDQQHNKLPDLADATLGTSLDRKGL